MSEMREHIAEAEYGEELHWSIREDIENVVKEVARRVAAGERLISVNWELGGWPDHWGSEGYTELVIKFADPVKPEGE